MHFVGSLLTETINTTTNRNETNERNNAYIALYHNPDDRTMTIIGSNNKGKQGNMECRYVKRTTTKT